MAEDDEDRIPGERAEILTSRQVDNNLVLKRGAVAAAIIVFVGFAFWSAKGKKEMMKTFHRNGLLFVRRPPLRPQKRKLNRTKRSLK